MIVVVTGGRDFRDEAFVFRTLDVIHLERPITLLVEGGQRTKENGVTVGGADYFGALWALSKLMLLKTEQADWAQYGSRAGPIRNAHMLNKYKPDLVVAFPGGKGTADCVRKARNMNIEVREFTP